MVGGGALLPYADASRVDVTPLFYIQSARDDGQEAEGDGVEDDVCIGHGADADAGAGGELHGGRRVAVVVVVAVGEGGRREQELEQSLSANKEAWADERLGGRL